MSGGKSIFSCLSSVRRRRKMKKINNKNKYNQLILSFLQGDISAEEKKELLLWLDSSSENKSYFESIEKIWKYTLPKEKKEYDVEAALKKVNKRINVYENNMFNKKENWFTKHYAQTIAVAAIFIIGLILSILFVNKNNITSYIAQNDEEQLVLPDGTNVILNKNATITYNKKFNIKERSVKFSGIAHFDVAKDPRKPFIINTDNVIVEVLGTDFNINAEKNADKYTVDLFSGKIKMYSIDENNNQIEQIMLLPGERGTYNKTSQRIEHQYQLSSNNSMSSNTEILDFNNVTLKTVTEALSQAYNINIYLDEKYNDLRLTAHFENETLENIFNTLVTIFNMQIVRIGNTVTIR